MKGGRTGPTRPRLGISACLLGEEVRFDGGHKYNGYVNLTLAEHFEFVSFCPEVASGLGTPRTPIRLVNVDGQVRALDVKNPALDATDKLLQYASSVLPQLAGLSGYIVKKGSPSCGMERVKVYHKEIPTANGRGIYTEQVLQSAPNLPVEEEGRLMDSRLRENFITRVFTYFRWQQMLEQGLSARGLVEFHTRHKFLIQAHNETIYRELGRMVSNAGAADLVPLSEQYLTRLMQALSKPSSTRGHTNVLMHIMGFFKDALDGPDKQELLEVIEQFRLGLVPLIVPITLINHFQRRYPSDYIKAQYYLQPHPRELMLLNHI